MISYVLLVVISSILVGIATLVVRLVAPKWEKRDLPKWIAPVVLLVLLAIAVAALEIFG